MRHFSVVGVLTTAGTQIGVADCRRLTGAMSCCEQNRPHPPDKLAHVVVVRKGQICKTKARQG